MPATMPCSKRHWPPAHLEMLSPGAEPEEHEGSQIVHQVLRQAVRLSVLRRQMLHGRQRHTGVCQRAMNTGRTRRPRFLRIPGLFARAIWRSLKARRKMRVDSSA